MQALNLVNMFGHLKDLTTKAEIIATLHFGAKNVHFSCTGNLAVCSQEKLPDSSIYKNVMTGSTKMSCLSK